MLAQGVWVLTLVLLVGRGEVMLRPIGIYESSIECLSLKPGAERKYKVPVTCIHYNTYFMEHGVNSYNE